MKSLTTTRRSLIIASVLFSTASLPGFAADKPTAGAVVTDAAIRDWLATHPEAVDKIVHDSLLRQGTNLLTELQQAAAQKQQADRMAKFQQALPAAHDTLYNDPHDGREGAVNPAATVVILYDYECPYCKAIQPTLARLLQERSDVAVIYKEFPILGPASVFAAKVSLAAVGQGKYSAFHAALLASKIPEHQLTEEQILAMAKGAALDVDRLKTDMNAPAIEAKIAANKALASNLGIQGTPGVIIGNQLVPGTLPYDRLVQLIEEAKSQSAAGTVAPGKQAALTK
jgi:protein-disulfide isomerase